MVRENTNKLIQMAEEGIIDWETIARACMCYMSEDEVTDMANDNDFFYEDVDDEDNEFHSFDVLVIYRGEKIPSYFGQFETVEEARDSVCNDLDVAHYQITDENGKVVLEDDWDDEPSIEA